MASAALVAGALAGTRWTPPKAFLAALLAFAGGALTAALAFELFEPAFEAGGHLASGMGLAAGAVTFVAADLLIERRQREEDDDSDGAGLGLLAGVTLDGVPENLALGTTLAAGKGSVALLAAIFVSNFPEALVGARTMRQNGWSARLAVGTWTAVAALLAATTIAGASLLGGLEGAPLGFVLAFAGGAVLASLADTVFPKAFTDGGPYVALATAAGFLVAFELGVA